MLAVKNGMSWNKFNCFGDYNVKVRNDYEVYC